MVTVSELVVAIRGEGIDQTQEDLEGMEESVEESTESMSDQATALEDLSTEFAGALSVAAVGLAVAAGSLLSQVPVIGQLFDSLFAVVEAIAFQMNQVLRPVLTPLANAFYAIATAIFNANGPLGTLIGLVATVGSIALLAIGAIVSLGAAATALSAAVGFLTTGLSVLGTIVGFAGTVLSGLATVAGIVISALGTLAGAVSLPAVALGLAVAAIVGLIAALLFNFGGLRDKLIKILSTIADKFVSGFKSFLKDPIGFVQNFITSIVDLLLNTDWLALGGKVGSAIIGGIKDTLGLGDGAEGVLDFSMDSLMPDMEMPEFESSAGMSAFKEIESTQSFEQRKKGLMSPEDIEALQKGEDRQFKMPRQRDTTQPIFLEGREIGRGTQGERFDESARRGQTF